MDEKIYRLALVRLKGLGRIRREILLNAFGSAEKIFTQASARDISFVTGLPREEVAEILAERNRALDIATEEIETAHRLGAKVFFPGEKEYPPPLLNIRDRPEVVYIKGAYRESDFFSIGVVGSRKATSYGLEVTRKLVGELGQLGVASVSGLAEGIDSAAHLASIDSGARTIAVLGSGIGVCYPTHNRKLMDKISSAECGAVISEYPPDMMPTPASFPYRNRIISALSLGVLVVEAGEKSGALITARHALEQGKDVFAVPGNIFSQMSRGTHNLIKMGAKLVESAQDIIEELSELARWLDRQKSSVVDTSFPSLDFSKEEKSIVDTAPLDDKDKKIIDALISEGSPVSTDFLSIKTELPPGELSGRLLELELKGVVRSLPGSYYSLTRSLDR